VIVRAVVLLVVWVLLQGELTVANVVGGVFVVAAIEALFPSRRHTSHRLQPVGAAVYVGTLVRDLVVSSWTVVVTVLRPNADRVHAEVVPVQLATRSPLVAALVANSISLTPGTLTVDIEHAPTGFVLQVHVLGRIDPSEFAASILALERRVARAAVPDGAASADADRPADIAPEGGS
jgi:multicomponent Na+:H+ antiporter subunit E